MDLRLIQFLFRYFILISLALILKPQKIGNHLVVFFNDPVNITLKKNTPPFVAFEEIQANFAKSKTDYDILDSNRPNIELKSETGDRFINSQDLPLRHVQLAELVIKKQVQAVNWPSEKIKKQEAQFDEYASTGDVSSLRPFEKGKRLLSLAQQRQDFGNETKEDLSGEVNLSQLPEQSKTRLQLAQARSGLLNQDWTSPEAEAENDLHQRAQAEIAKQLSQPVQQKVFIAGADGRTNTGSSESARATGGTNDEQSSEAPVPSQVQVVGQFTVFGGIGVTNDHYIELRRIEQGIVKESGRVVAMKGEYSISVSSFSGELVARVIHNSGRLEGERRVRLAQSAVVKAGNVYRGPNLVVNLGATTASVPASYTGPSRELASKKVTSSIMGGTKIVEAKAKVAAEFQDLHSGSSTLLRTTHPAFLPTLSLIVADHSYETPLFNEATLSGLRALVSDQMGVFLSQEQPLVWGRVIFDGHPVRGAKIKTAQNYSGKAIYLNDFMLPDKTLEATSNSGYFVLPVEQEGFYSLIAEKDERIFGFSNTVAEAGSIAYVEIEDSMQKQNMAVRTYDAFSGLPVSTQVSVQSSEMIYELVKGEEQIEVSNVSRFALAQVKGAGEYLDSSFVYDEAKGVANFPLIKKAWLEQIITENRLNLSPTAGTVVGFSPDEDFEVYLPTLGESALEIIYFNNKGEVLPRSELGPAGGGFIVFNLPESTQEVSVYLTKSQRIITKVTPIVPNEVITHLMTLN